MIKNMFKTKVSVRFSEYESLGKKDYLFKKIKWLWLDNFTRIELSHKFYKYLKRKKVKFVWFHQNLLRKAEQVK